MTRKKQLQWLIGLSAASAALQYVVQGALASGADLATFPPWFWTADFALWAFRALIESAVIVYLFQTRTDDPTQRRVLTFFEIALIGLITLTVGPALRALGLGVAMRDSLNGVAFWAWNFGLAAYTSLMMGAAGYAYRVQPDDDVSGQVREVSAIEERAALIRAEVDGKEARAAAIWELGDDLGVSDVARLSRCSEATARKARTNGK